MEKHTWLAALALVCGWTSAAPCLDEAQVAGTARHRAEGMSADSISEIEAEQAIIDLSREKQEREAFDEVIGQFASCPGSFVGTVSSCKVARDAEGAIQTTCTVAVEHVLQGSPAIANLVISQEGGCLARKCMTAGHGPDLTPGLRAAIGYEVDSAGQYHVTVLVPLGAGNEVGPAAIGLEEFAAHITAARRDH